ncbi:MULTISPECIES: DUF397 domain-containing protein [unclassified Streptomyces]|uniref:DUF397 domain-containing protein n=1 Tax=unclassified Streptomyces TaxID=2593676 RepID=UPI002E15E876|nr:DUF397 domain-containing protein [Streptomyces sp. NBC_01197]WSS49722.1 DUF397 domain-containing protein [Streptomyces sp. NBC_01180]
MRRSKQVVTGATLLLGWRKSSYSGASQGDCLEVADGYRRVPVRDSKNPHGPALSFPSDDWTAFVSAVKGGHLTP